MNSAVVGMIKVLAKKLGVEGPIARMVIELDINKVPTIYVKYLVNQSLPLDEMVDENWQVVNCEYVEVGDNGDIEVKENK